LAFALGIQRVINNKFTFENFVVGYQRPGDTRLDTLSAELPLRPSEYVRRNCWFGASMLSAADAARRDEAGVGRVMWGADYPHTEGTWPHSKDAMTAAVDGIPDDEARRMLGLNAAEFYGFDLDVLEPIAARIGPAPASAVG